MNKNILKFWLKDNKWLILIVILAFILSSWPSFVFKLPITQTDGVSHYVFAKTYAEKGTLNADVPEYVHIGALERKLNQLPPLVIITLGALLKYFGNDFFFANGFYGSLFFIIGAIFLYYLVKELFNKKVALLSSIFFILNVRAYYTLFTGIYPSFISFCLTFPALYFTYLYLRNNKISHFILGIIFTGLVCFTYIQQAFLLLILQLFLFIGFILEDKIKIKARLKIKFSKIKSKFSKQPWLYYAIVLSLFIFVVCAYLFKVQKRIVFLSELFTSWLSPYFGYQAVWANFFLADGPILVVLSILGFLLVLSKSRFKQASLYAGCFFVLLISFIFIPETAWIKTYIFRFYVIFFVLISILASYYFVEKFKKINIKKIFIALLILSLLFQIVKLGYFFSKVGPSITSEEYEMSQLVKEDKSILYVNNIDGDASTFRSFDWILASFKINNFDIKSEIDYNKKYDYVFIRDKNAINKPIEGYGLLRDGKSAQLYEYNGD